MSTDALMQSDIQQLNMLRSKMAQGINIRRSLILSKLKLFEEFESLNPYQRNDQLKEFLRRYELLYNKELRIVDMFRRGVDSGMQLLNAVIPSSEKLKGEVKYVLGLYRRLDKILRSYESRMMKEDKLLDKTEVAPNQVELFRELHDDFKEEIAGDFEFMQNLKGELKDVRRIKEVVDKELAMLKTARLSLFGTGILAVGTAATGIAYGNPGVLGLGVSIELLMAFIESTLPETSAEEKRILKSLANFDALRKMSFK